MSNAASFVPNLLMNSTTKINRASYVRLNDPGAAASPSGKALLKASFVGALQLQTGEVDAVLKALAPEGATPTATMPRDMTFWSLLRQYEGAPLASELPAANTFIDIAPSDLLAFADGLITVRKQAVQRLQETDSPDTSAPLGRALVLLNKAHSSSKSFNSNSQSTPVGWLNLERLEMTPVGIERGGLLATIPLARRKSGHSSCKKNGRSRRKNLRP
jgi:hypothetical protein